MIFRNIRIACLSILFLLIASSVYSQFEYSDFDSLLQKYVSGNNVKYSQLLEAKDKLNFRIDEDQGILYLSSFFDWLRKNKNIEEPDMLDYIKLYYDGQIKEEYYSFDIEYSDYNCQLNDFQ